MSCECHDTDEEHKTWFAEELERFSWMAGMAKRGAPSPVGVPDPEEDRLEAWKIKNDWRSR